MKELGTVIPYLKKIQKINESFDEAFEFWRHEHFFFRNQKLLLYQEIQTYIAFQYIISSSFSFSESLMVVLINMVANLTMSPKLTTLGLLKINIF